MFKIIGWLFKQSLLAVIFTVVAVNLYSGFIGQSVSLLCVGNANNCAFTPVSAQRAAALQGIFYRGGEEAKQMAAQLKQKAESLQWQRITQ